MKKINFLYFSKKDPPKYPHAGISPVPGVTRRHRPRNLKNGNQNEQQNPKCKQFLLFATRQAPENHGGTLRCVLPPPNPFVVFPMGRQGAPRYLGVQNLKPIFELEGVGHVGSLQHVLSGILAVCAATERDPNAGRLPNHESSHGVGRGVF